MPKIALKAGAELDVLSKGELDHSLGSYFAVREASRLRGIKHMRLPELLYGTASSNKLTLSVPNGQLPVGPKLGYLWSISRLVVNGLTTGSTPDVVNLYHDSTTGQPMWTFDGNHNGYTFGKLQMTLFGGETFALASVGTFNATGQITLCGELIEVPEELAGKLG